MQKDVQRFQKIGALQLEEATTSAASFVPVVVKADEVVVVRFYYSPYVGVEKWPLAQVMNTDTLAFDFNINGAWKANTFVVGYVDFREKFKTDYTIVVPPRGYAQRWF